MTHIVGHSHILLICLSLLTLPDWLKLSARRSCHNTSELCVAEVVCCPVQESSDVSLTDSTCKEQVMVTVPKLYRLCVLEGTGVVLVRNELLALSTIIAFRLVY